MKKLAYILAFAGISAVAGSAVAATAPIQSGTPMDNADCALLRDRVSVNTSAGVQMAWNCAVASNVITVAACHESGSQRPQTVDCAATGVDPNTGDPIWNDESCPTPATDPAATFEIQGRRVFTGSSAGGNVAGGTLNSATCNQAALGAQPNQQLP